MRRPTYKLFLILSWIFLVFGYLWLASFVYEENKSFALFILIAIAGNLAYDGLKTVISYNPLYQTDIKSISAYVIGFIASLMGSVIFLIIGSQLFIYSWLSEPFAKSFAASGFLACIVSGMYLLSQAEKKFNATC